MSTTAPAPWSTDTVVPERVRTAVDAVLNDTALSEPEREVLTTRVEHWYPDVADGLATLYGERGEDVAPKIGRASCRERV